MVPYVTIATGVPRTLHVRFPYGNPFGEPGDAARQRQILESTLQWLYDAPGPNRLFKLGVSWRRTRKGPGSPATTHRPAGNPRRQR